MHIHTTYSIFYTKSDTHSQKWTDRVKVKMSNKVIHFIVDFHGTPI